jgi:ABC-type bacteriocin/lantibiotic exporter with double-glycine peptidase domain
MAEAPWSGFPADHALWRLARLKGHEGGFQAFRDAHWTGPGPEQMAEALEVLGVQARAALVPVRDLRFLERPTLVQLADDTWVVLVDLRRGRFLLETPCGRLALEPDALRGRLSGRALDLSPALPPGTGLWDRLRPLFLRQRRELALAGAATLLLQLLALVLPAMTAVVMNRALPDGARSLLGLAVAGIALATAHQVWIGWIRDRALLFIATRVEISAERGFLEHALRCPFPFLQGRTLGDLMQACNGFAAARDLLPLKTVGVFLDGSLGLVQLAVMFVLLPVPSVLILLATALLALAAFLAGRAQAGLEARQVEAQAREHGLLIELVAGIATLKGAGAEASGLARWRGRFRRVLALELARGRIGLGSELGLGLASQALAVVLFAHGGLRLLEGSLKAGTLFAFLQLSAGFSAAFMSLVHTGLILMILKPQLDKAQEILAQEPEPRPRRQPPGAGPVPVLMEGVWFRYSPDGPWVLRDYDLRVEAGGKHALTGPSGSGKTTVLRLLAGLHVPEKGTVRVGGHKPAEARHNLAYLPQFVRIFGGSILDNLRVFSCGAPPERILETARRTGLQELADSLPMGYRTPLPPEGRSLSGGQRQLIALTGALASGRPLLLLDEAMANLDPERAARLREQLETGPWTVVAASHG